MLIAGSNTQVTVTASEISRNEASWVSDFFFLVQGPPWMFLRGCRMRSFVLTLCAGRRHPHFQWTRHRCLLADCKQ